MGFEFGVFHEFQRRPGQSEAEAFTTAFDQVDARGIKMSDADIKFSSFVDADFSQLSIQGRTQGVAANLFGTLFTGCNMTKAKMTPEHLREARFVNCKR